MIHPTAVCEAGCHIGAGTCVWHFSHVMAGATIGAECVVGQGCFVAASAVIGSGVKLQNNVSVFDGVHLEDYVFCGPGVVFTNVRTPRSEISRKAEFETTRVCRGASLGANVTVRCGVTIGRYALVGAGSVVVADVEAYSLVVGNPARHRGWVGRGGAALDFDEHGRAACDVTGYQYRLIDGVLNELPL